MKYMLIATILAASMCGKTPERSTSEETELVDEVPTAADGVPEANKKLRRLKTGLDKTANDRMKKIDGKVGGQ